VRQYQKFTYTRSKRIMELYRTIPCQHCGAQDGTVCGAHSNQAKHGHGRGIKASDEYCASLCHQCHYTLDQGKGLTRDEKVSMWDRAHKKTMDILLPTIAHLRRSKAA